MSVKIRPASWDLRPQAQLQPKLFIVSPLRRARGPPCSRGRIWPAVRMPTRHAKGAIRRPPRREQSGLHMCDKRRNKGIARYATVGSLADEGRGGRLLYPGARETDAALIQLLMAMELGLGYGTV